MKQAWRAVTGILLLDKPAGLSSNAALQHVRRLYRAEKAGHTGSLDPLATGLLPICLGEATKLSGLLLESDKRYTVRATVGTRTSTGDAEGEIVSRSDPEGFDAAAIQALLPRFTGPILQTPPMHSALKHRGERLYDIARRGEAVERPARPVTLHALRLLGAGPGWFELDVKCSKGTYIRSLVEDLAAAGGQCAHVAVLRRTAAGPFDGTSMVPPETLEQLAGQGLAALDALLLPPLAGLAQWPQVAVDLAQAGRLAQGQAIRVETPGPAGAVAVTLDGNLLGLADRGSDGRLSPRRWLVAGGGKPA